MVRSQVGHLDRQQTNASEELLKWMQGQDTGTNRRYGHQNVNSDRIFVLLLFSTMCTYSFLNQKEKAIKVERETEKKKNQSDFSLPGIFNKAGPASPPACTTIRCAQGSAVAQGFEDAGKLESTHFQTLWVRLAQEPVKSWL